LNSELDQLVQRIAQVRCEPLIRQTEAELQRDVSRVLASGQTHDDVVQWLKSMLESKSLEGVSETRYHPSAD